MQGCDNIKSQSTIYDPFFKEDIKIIQFRVSPQNVLKVMYNSENEIISTEIIIDISFGRVILWIILVISSCFLFIEADMQKLEAQFNKTCKK